CGVGINKIDSHLPRQAIITVLILLLHKASHEFWLAGAVNAFGPGDDLTNSVAVGDLNNDGWLDIVTGNTGGQFGFGRAANLIYLNQGDGQFGEGLPFGPPDISTESVALGDLDGDGSLDIVAGNFETRNMIFLKRGSGPDGGLDVGEGRFFGDPKQETRGVALGDMDGDGDLDIVTATSNGNNRLYFNDGAGNFFEWVAITAVFADSVALADMNGDATVDVVMGHNFRGDVTATQRSGAVYLNDGSGQFPTLTRFDPGHPLNFLPNVEVAVGDLDNNGSPDIAKLHGAAGFDWFYNGIGRTTGLVNNPPRLTVNRPLEAGPAPLYSSAERLTETVIPVNFTLIDPESDPVGQVDAFYSLNGGGQWFRAVATNTVTTNLAAGPDGVSHTFNWDTFASGFFGQSDNVTLRFVAYAEPSPAISGTYRYEGQVPGPYQRPFAAASTFPFSVEGTRVQVLSGDTPVPDALVYSLPAGKAVGGAAIGGSRPLTTDALGFLRGRGRIADGDQLLALAQVPLNDTYQTRFGSQLRLFHTNGRPTATGLQAFSVSQGGVQQIQVSPDQPLILFDLVVSLEWDASNDPAYLRQLEFDLQRASEHLYDFTNGQMALGNIVVNQNRDFWEQAHIRIHATNRLRPFATIGGVVLTDTVHFERPDIVYRIGRINMGATWNRYGNPTREIGGDWAAVLAHELGHYLLFLEDSYVGLKEVDGAQVLTAVEPCPGSAMGDVYNLNNTEFVFQPSDEDRQTCEQTLAYQELGRDEWDIITRWYPELSPPENPNTGPSLLPFELTTVTIFPPDNPVEALIDPTFSLTYRDGIVGSSNARGYLLRHQAGTPQDRDDYHTIVDLGNPVGGQNRLLARGAAPGDRLCVFDPARDQFGCETVKPGDERLNLRRVRDWQPTVQITPVNSTTFTLDVSGITPDVALQARLFPSGELALTPTQPFTADAEGVYRTQLILDRPALRGHIQLWVDEEATPRRETIVSYGISGNPGTDRGGGGTDRGGGGTDRGGEGTDRGGGGTDRGGGGTD
ncbi:MAG: VCBS repeat-containing protein, partial [Anaerolineae bacterium]|nr:VCBS repeat-containing protein [Anaerolineae bacterium]